jgi:hypothetical protein
VFVFACLRLRFRDPSMRFTFILFIAFMAAVVEYGMVAYSRGKGKGEDQEEVVELVSSGCGCLLFVCDEIRCRCMLRCAAWAGLPVRLSVLSASASSVH